MEHLLRADEVAEVLGVSRSAAYELINRRVLRSVRIGRSVRVRSADLEQWISDQDAAADLGRVSAGAGVARRAGEEN